MGELQKFETRVEITRMSQHIQWQDFQAFCKMWKVSNFFVIFT